jgi:hypothetical protein
MAEQATSPPSVAPVAPALPSADQVAIGLGPDLSLYPSELRPATAPPAPSVAPEAAATEPSPPPEPAAGSAPEPPAEDQQTQPQGSRRRANEDAYQRGLTEGRAALEREQQQRTQQQQWDQTQREATERVEQLFRDFESADYATQDRAHKAILQMYRGNRQAQALQQLARQQLLGEMAADFGKLRDLDGIGETDYQDLHTAPSAAELAKRAFALGKRSGDEQVTRLQAEVEGLRGRLVGSRATPEPANGRVAASSGITIEQYLAMSPKEARSLPSGTIDELTRQMAAEAARGR